MFFFLLEGFLSLKDKTGGRRYNSRYIPPGDSKSLV